MPKHIIHKQQVVLEMSRQEEAFNFQNKVSSLFNSGLQAAIERVLDEASLHNEVIRIDKLKLDLGTINAQNFDKEFKEKLVEALKTAVTAGKSGAQSGSNVVITAQPASNRDAVIYFLEHGTLPWYSNVKNIATWENEIFEQWRLQDWQYVLQWVKAQLNSYPHIVQRLIFQFSNKFLEQLLVQPAISAGFLQSAMAGYTWQALYDDIFYISQRANLQRDATIRSRLWNEFIRLLFNETIKADGLAFIGQVVIKQLQSSASQSEVLAQQDEIIQNLQTGVVKNVFNKIVRAIENKQPLNEMTKWDEPTVEPGRREGTQNKDADETGGATKNENELIVDEYVIEEHKQDESFTADNDNAGAAGKTKPTVKKRSVDKPEAVTYVNNCGIVLLHPFLPAYFVDIGLIEAKKFINAEAQQRAVLLLYYLATRETQAAEFNLELQKMMCGLAAEDTLETTLDLSAKEIEESENLLRAVIDYWPPLKNTSIKGFQITFLQRDGRLSETNDGWLLRVEQKAVDVLLGKLPWGFSTIRLSWMQNLLNVEWG